MTKINGVNITGHVVERTAGKINKVFLLFVLSEKLEQCYLVDRGD